MENNCAVFVVEKLCFVNFFDFIWTWTSNFKKVWTKVGLGLSFKNFGLDLDCKIRQSAHLCPGGEVAIRFLGSTS